MSDPAYLTVKDVCDRYRIDRRTVYALIDSGKLEAIRFSRRVYRITETALQQFEEAHRAKNLAQ